MRFPARTSEPLRSVKHRVETVNAPLDPADWNASGCCVLATAIENLPNGYSNRYVSEPHPGSAVQLSEWLDTSALHAHLPSWLTGLSEFVSGGVRPQWPEAHSGYGSPRKGVVWTAGFCILRIWFFGFMTVALTPHSSPAQRLARARRAGTGLRAAAIPSNDFVRHSPMAYFHRVPVRRAGVIQDAGPDAFSLSHPIGMYAAPLRRLDSGTASRRPVGTGDPGLPNMPGRVSHGQQNAYRFLPPGRDPGGGAAR